MKFNKILLLSIVLISLLAVGTVSASDNTSDVIKVAKDSDVVTVENDIDQNTAKISAKDDVEKDVVSVADDAPLTENGTSDVSEITIYSGGQQISTFNFTKANGTYDFADIISMINQSDMNMSNFGNFADLFSNFNFTGENKTFDFKIAGDVNDVSYNLAIVSIPDKFVFDYFVKSPKLDNEFNNITNTDLSIFVDGKFLTNLTFNANALDMGELMKKFNMTGFDNLNIKDMMSQFNFTDMAAQFGNSTSSGSSNKTFDFKIDGEVGNIKYDLIVKSNESSFVFDYKIHYKQLEVSIDFDGLKVTTVNTAVDGKIGKYLTVTLKDQFGNALNNKSIHLTLNNKVYALNTDSNGKAKLQLNIANAGSYSAAVTFLGDNSCAGKFETAKVTVSKQAAKLTTAKKSYKAKAKTKKFTATFKSAKGKAIKNKKITFTVKGKTYSAKTNSKGVATVNIKINKKGTYKVTAKFAGDNTYKAVSKAANLILK